MHEQQPLKEAELTNREVSSHLGLREGEGVRDRWGERGSERGGSETGRASERESKREREGERGGERERVEGNKSQADQGQGHMKGNHHTTDINW